VPTCAPHHLRNPFAKDLVYLSGGERRAREVADYPRLGKRMVRVGGAASLHAIEGAEGFAGLEPMRLP
jgi:uncharacterized cupin superfamily protein